MRNPPRLTKEVGKFDQRLRCAVLLKLNTTVPRWASSSEARNFFAAAMISAVAVSGVEVVWAKLLRPTRALNSTKKSSASVLFIRRLERTRSHGSTRTLGSSASSSNILRQEAITQMRTYVAGMEGRKL
jgi:hypothetical protein